MITIDLTGITGFGYHGVLEHERRNGQPFVVDVSLTIPEPRTDELDQTVNYAEVAERVHACIEGEPFQLIESLAARIVQEILPLMPGGQVTVRVHKPQAPIAVPFEGVSVVLSANCDDAVPGGRQ